jgi:hypothetical protein
MARATKPKRTRRITVAVTPEEFELLRVLARTHAMEGGPLFSAEGQVTRILRHLVHSAADGVRRPGAWERGWVEQAFGPVPEDELEVVPDAVHARRPRKAVR